MRRALLCGAMVVAAAGAVAGFSGMGFGAPTPGGGAVVNNRVLVVPFATLNVSPDQQWMGKAVQETVVADLGRTDAYSPVEFSGQVVVEDNATAAKLARDGGEAFAVRGAAQVVNAEVRLTAQLIDAKSGDTVATGITTGRIDDLLKMEDDLANQLRIGPVPAAPAAAQGGLRVYTTPSNSYPQQANGVPAAGNMNQPLNAGTAPVAGSDYQDFGAPAYYYSPVYTPSYLDQEPYTYGPVYDYPYSYYGGYPVVGIGVGVGGFHRGFGVGGFHGVVGGFHGGGFRGSFHGGGFSGGHGHR